MSLDVPPVEEQAPAEPAPIDQRGAGLAAGLLGALGAVALAESGAAPPEAREAAGRLLGPLAESHASLGEDLFLAGVVCVTAYCLAEMSVMQLRCPHFEARVHVACNVLATLCSLYGIGAERLFRESPGLWWAILTPVLYGLSNVSMTQLTNMYKGPLAHKRLFELGQSFTLSFQGIHMILWSSVYPVLFWAAMPFWYWSIRKLVEPIIMMHGVASGDDPRRGQRAARGGANAWEEFGNRVDVATVVFMAVNFAAAVIDNAYMGAYTVRGPEGFFEVSRTLVNTPGWGSDHLRMALVKPALGSLVLSMGVFVATLVSRKRVPLWAGVPVAALLSALGPWVVLFWHRLVDPTEPWLPEFMGDQWGPGPLGQLLQLGN